ncbi:nitrous oxide-stimulated promoter family protein [Treponema sp. Marseille-Q4130]|uniref:nitrous oxide-stimulated promoter family protein n=1 Tax=Treponema sp. Marseille-Q4130 TaxID=2766702 RepID=UPI0016524978|nr:nitrous oxide-stimulated promoter family protein [Treponema sp. Marseille-Q4130]MBC6720741.1 nitrous oxide-stimulated promoter family protein [Treponema sp. Marseille-Q4130]
MGNSTETKTAHEKKIIGEMIRLYCRKKHGRKNTLCSECGALYEYAVGKIDKCPFMREKTFCSACKAHCYSQEKRNKIKTVMRFSGPRIFLYHPILVIKHIIVGMQTGKTHD